jgi:hypothetical protein
VGNVKGLLATQLQLAALAAARDLLDEAGIPYCVPGGEFATRLEPFSPFLPPLCRIRFGEDRAAEARKPLEEIDGIRG